MKRRDLLLLATLLAFILLIGLAWLVLRPHPPTVPDPVYDGHPISYWVDPSAWPKIAGSAPVPHPAAGSLDTNALPYLIQALKRRDGAARTAYNRLWLHLPGWLGNRLPTTKYAWRVRENACAYLGNLGTAARPAIPELVRLLREDVTMVKVAAALALMRIASGNDQNVIQALATATKDKDSLVRDLATHALNYLDPTSARTDVK